jgi:hypothetical protein
MGLVVKEEKQLYPSLTNSKVFVSYGTGNINELMKSVIMHDIESKREVKDVENR